MTPCIKKTLAYIFILIIVASSDQKTIAKEDIGQIYPIGKPGLTKSYRVNLNDIPGSCARKFDLSIGNVVNINDTPFQWLSLHAEKENTRAYSIWMLCSEYPSATLETAQENISRYIISIADSKPIEFTNQNLGTTILPNSGVWKYLLPRSDNSNNPLESGQDNAKYLGLEYTMTSSKSSQVLSPPEETVNIELTPDLLIGVPHNAKQKDETRRYDESDYKYIDLTRENYIEMMANGINVFRVNVEQATWISEENIYYWGIGGEDITYPEDLYRSNYMGPVIFLDEPMVGTRDHVIKPKFIEDPSFRKTITPQIFLEAFEDYFHEKKYKQAPTQLLKGLSNRKDVDIGDMDFLQQNIYSWETMVSSAYYQLSEGDGLTPRAMVFEPPGRFGAKRVLPELNMSFDCQIPTENPKNLIGMINGFLRGASRVTGKEWGISVYGQVVRSEALWYMTQAYDLGATHFFYWDSYQLAAVPYNEYLSLSRQLREHARNFPNRDLEKLKNRADVAILMPSGYNLGHVKMGIGNISGLPELNMERKNSYGIRYREVMNNFYVEIERCIRLGIEYDLFWNMDNLNLQGYDEIVTIREDGNVGIEKNGIHQIIDSARIPQRPDGDPPQLSVEVASVHENGSYSISAQANVTETSTPIYYTQGIDKYGIYNNQYVLWELYGPAEEDYTDLWSERWNTSISETNYSAIAEIKFNIEKPGKYRLRVSTCDLAGRSSVVWKEINIQ